MPTSVATHHLPKQYKAVPGTIAHPSVTAARRWFTLVAAVTQIIAPTLHPLTGLGQGVGAMAMMTPNFAIPAAFTFAIWWPIFLLALAYAWQQLRGPFASHPAFQHLGWLPGATFALGTLWMVLAQFYGNGWFLVLISIAMLACMLRALHIGLPLVNNTMGNVGKWVVLPLLGMFAGWLTIATFLSIASVNQLAANQIWPLLPVEYAIATLTPAALLGLLVVIRMGARYPWGTQWYGLTLVWALFGTIAANSTYQGLTSGTVGLYAFALALAILAALGITQNEAAHRPPAATTTL